MPVHHIALCCALSLLDEIAAAAPLPLFEEEQPLQAVLSAPLGQVYAQRRKDDRLYFPGFWSYNDNNGEKQRLSVQIRTRGIYRRLNCRLPPLQLNFKKSEVKGTLFKGQDKLKLVGPCGTRSRDDQFLILEYLAYRAFDLVADGHSFDTRMIELSYVDTEQKEKPWTDMTFVIEDEDDLAKRLGRILMKVPKIDSSQLDPVQSTVVELFQYMIGNTDYSTIRAAAGLDCCHNVKLMALKDSREGIIPVPYDFDSSGIVDAPYAKPSETIPIRSVRKRFYTGRCRDPSFLDNAIARYIENRAAIIALFRDSEYLEDRYKKKTVSYLEEFFEVINDPAKVERELSSRCRG